MMLMSDRACCLSKFYKDFGETPSDIYNMLELGSNVKIEIFGHIFLLGSTKSMLHILFS